MAKVNPLAPKRSGSNRTSWTGVCVGLDPGGGAPKFPQSDPVQFTAPSLR
jgi:hypothetical protein